jgi:hypothetical protein
MKKIIIKSLILIFVLTTVFGLEISTTKAQLKECSQVSQGQCTQNGKTCTKYLPRGELAGQLGDIECPNDKGGVETTFGENVLQNGSGIGWTFINIGWGVLVKLVKMLKSWVLSSMHFQVLNLQIKLKSITLQLVRLSLLSPKEDTLLKILSVRKKQGGHISKRWLLIY